MAMLETAPQSDTKILIRCDLAPLRSSHWTSTLDRDKQHYIEKQGQI